MSNAKCHLGTLVGIEVGRRRVLITKISPVLMDFPTSRLHFVKGITLQLRSTYKGNV